ncbi:ras-related protein Rab-43-like isoform X1 [Sycon ciliatum]|uniref:ras-related protein Rab-43-like isoform X1 n=1 Tax=Sycon ciliatum TaxID=27933 RepID=UPI0031F65497
MDTSATASAGNAVLEGTLGGSSKRVFKVVLVGEVNVGKTSIFQRLRAKRFQEWGTTVGVDQFTKEYEVDGVTVTLQIWDTAGSEKYRTLTANYYHSAAACVYVYDLGAVDSLYNLSTWADDARRFEPRHCMFLVGNKCDLPEDDIALEDSTIEAFHRELEFKLDAKYQQEAAPGIGLGLGFDRPRSLLRNLSPRSLRQNKRKNKKLESWKVSAKTGVDIEKLFDGLARTLVERAGAIAPRTDHSSRVQLAAEPEPRKCPC